MTQGLNDWSKLSDCQGSFALLQCFDKGPFFVAMLKYHLLPPIWALGLGLMIMMMELQWMGRFPNLKLIFAELQRSLLAKCSSSVNRLKNLWYAAFYENVAFNFILFDMFFWSTALEEVWLSSTWGRDWRRSWVQLLCNLILSSGHSTISKCDISYLPAQFCIRKLFI